MKLLKFSADWCDPCKQLQAHLERILPEEFPHIELVDMNITDDPDVSKNWGVRSIPTLIVLDIKLHLLTAPTTSLSLQRR